MSSATVTPKFVMRLSITFIFLDAQRKSEERRKGNILKIKYYLFSFVDAYRSSWVFGPQIVTWHIINI